MSLYVHVIAPSGRDAELITSALEKHGVPTRTGDAAGFISALDDENPLGPVLVAEEALTPPVVAAFGSFVANQPSWSDLPILILTGSGRESVYGSIMQIGRLRLGAPILLERPIRIAPLVSSVQAALRARARQYQIKEERAVLEAMLDNLPVGVVLAKASGEIVKGNKRLEAIVGHPLILSPDLRSHGEWVAFHADGRRVAAEEFPLVRALQSGKTQPQEEYLYERGDGTRAWVSIAASPILDDRGEITGGVVALSDIDLQKKSEAALIQNEKLAAVGRLAASISHEINNPLAAVTNLIFLARNSENLPSDAITYLDSADQELSRVTQIVSHTLHFHRQSTKPSAITLQELLGPTLSLFRGRLLNARIKLELQYRDKDLITCYEGEIRQVLNNLVGNAIDAMKQGGKLLIRTTSTKSWKTGVYGVRLSVADTGSGMPMDVVSQIFEAFFTTKGSNGSGLGLWISKGIVEKHQGSLRVSSRCSPDKSGTVFSLFLPLDPFEATTRS